GIAEHLTDDGRFVLEAFVPDITRFHQGQRVGATSVGPDAVTLETSLHDPVAQRVRSQHVVFSEQGVRLYPVEVRYAWPSELDLLVRLAALGLRERWGGRSGEAFGASSSPHVPVYAHAGRERNPSPQSPPSPPPPSPSTSTSCVTTFAACRHTWCGTASGT